MNCSKCGRKILKQMTTPDIYYKDINEILVLNYTYRCECGETTVLSEKEFNELEEYK